MISLLNSRWIKAKCGQYYLCVFFLSSSVCLLFFMSVFFSVFLFSQLRIYKRYASSKYSSLKGGNCFSGRIDKCKQVVLGIEWPLLGQIEDRSKIRMQNE